MSMPRSELQESARKVLAGARNANPAKAWQLVVDMGWPSLPVPEELDGLGGDLPAFCTLYGELGRELSGLPLLPSMITAEAVCQATDLPDRQVWIERLTTGHIVTLSLDRQDGATLDGRTIAGVLTAVPDADRAGHILVCAKDSPACALVPLDGAGITLSRRATWDETRRLFDVEFDTAPLAETLVLARDEAATRMMQRIQIHLHFALAADCLGGAGAVLELTVEYLKTRRQFDRPLAMFQALKHRCADLKTALTAADALLWRMAGGDGPGLLDPSTQAGALKSHTASVYRGIAEEAIQLHGGIGLTAEHPCHRFLKRATLNEHLGGEPDQLDAATGMQALQSLAHR